VISHLSSKVSIQGWLTEQQDSWRRVATNLIWDSATLVPFTIVSSLRLTCLFSPLALYVYNNPVARLRLDPLLFSPQTQTDKVQGMIMSAAVMPWS
jgi:hypothetical protein